MTQADGQIRNLSTLLDALQRKIDEDKDNSRPTISVEDVLELVGRRAYGPLLLIIGLVSISPAALLPGSTWAFALLTLVLSVQLALHKERPWMPEKALRMKLSGEKLEKFIQAVRPSARFTDKIIGARLSFLAEPPWVFGVALLCALAALITFPLGFIPLAPFLPGLAIAFFGLGITSRDGVLLLVGGGAMGGAIWLLSTRLSSLVT